MTQPMPFLTGVSSHPESMHILDGNHVVHRDRAACLVPGCPVVVSRCDYGDMWPWSCAHCPPIGAPTITKPGEAPPQPGMRVVFPVAQQEPTENLPGLRHLPTDTSQWNIHDYVTALTEPTRHHETFTPDGADHQARHRTDSPSLLQQLWSAAETSRGYDSGSRASFGSRPSASLEALDVALDIEQGVHQMLRGLGVVDSHDLFPDDTAAAVRHLGSLIDDSKEHKDRARTVRHWWAAARVVTGWDLPAWKPNNTCPLCAKRGELRVKYPHAFCVACRGVWDEEKIGLLVEHIRRENREDGDPEDERIGA